MSKFVFEWAGSGAPCGIQEVLLNKVVKDAFEPPNNETLAAVSGFLRLQQHVAEHLQELETIANDKYFGSLPARCVKLLLGHDGPELTPSPPFDVYWTKVPLFTSLSGRCGFMDLNSKLAWTSVFDDVMSENSKLAWAQLIEHAASTFNSPNSSTDVAKPSVFVVSVTMYPVRDVLLSAISRLRSIMASDLTSKMFTLLQTFCDDEHVLLKAASCTSSYDLSFPISKRLKADKEFMKQLFKVNRALVKRVEPDFQNDQDFWLECLQLETMTPYFFADYVPPHILTREFIKRVLGLRKPEILTRKGRYDHLPCEFADDSLLEAVELNPTMFYCGSSGQRHALLLQALQTNVMVYTKLAPMSQAKYDSIALVINKLPSLSDTTAILLLSKVCQSFNLREPRSKEALQLIRTYLLTCEPKRSVISLSFAKHFSGDDEVIHLCAKNTPEVLHAASQNLLRSRDAFMDIVAANGDALEFATRSMQNDEELVLLAIQSSPRAIIHASPSLRASKNVVVKALAHLSRLFKNVTPQQQEKEQPYQAVLKFVHKSVLLQPKVVQLAIEASSWEILPVEHLLTEEQVLNAIKRNPHVFEYLSPENRLNYEIAKAAVSSDKRLYIFVPPPLRQDPRIVQLV